MSIEVIASLLAGGPVETLGDVREFLAVADKYELPDDTAINGQLFLQMVGEPSVAGGFTPAHVLFLPGQPDEVVEEVVE